MYNHSIDTGYLQFTNSIFLMIVMFLILACLLILLVVVNLIFKSVVRILRSNKINT